MIEIGDFDGLDLTDREKAFDQAANNVAGRALAPRRETPRVFMTPDASAPGGYSDALQQKGNGNGN